MVFIVVHADHKMPLAESRLEILQVRKLINCVRMKETAAIRKLIENGIHGLINYQGLQIND